VPDKLGQHVPAEVLPGLQDAAHLRTMDHPLLEPLPPLRTLERVRALREDAHLGEAVLLLENELHAAPGKSAWLLLELLDLYHWLGMAHPCELVSAQIEALYAVDPSSAMPATEDPNFLRLLNASPDDVSRLLLVGHPDGRRLDLRQFRQALEAYAQPSPHETTGTHVQFPAGTSIESPALS
jgi:hypothetical protein